MHLDLDLQPGDDRLFTDEAFEQIERIEQGLLALERGELDSTTVNEVFRAAHTLKGSAGTIRHRRMAELTHAMEDIFGQVRSGSITDVAPFADRLLETIDILRALTEEVFAGETLTDAPEGLTRALRDLLDSATSAPAPAVSAGPSSAAPSAPSGTFADPQAARVLAEAPPVSEPCSIILVQADDTSEWQAIRLFQAVMEAEEFAAPGRLRSLARRDRRRRRRKPPRPPPARPPREPCGPPGPTREHR